MTRDTTSSQNLAAAITHRASSQTYYTIRLFVDRPLIADAYRAYAYFRWVDDLLDEDSLPKSQRTGFLEQQKTLMERCLRGEWPQNPTAEENMLVDLIRANRIENAGLLANRIENDGLLANRIENDGLLANRIENAGLRANRRQNDGLLANQGQNGGLQSYLRNMMAVMAFDTGRKGGLISQDELAEYSRCLATAVTEALHYFIGNRCSSPYTEARYLAVTAAHITHMLRDALEDADVGYFNIPREYLEAHNIAPKDVDSAAYRDWVLDRVQLARSYFAEGEKYLAQVENIRCRVAGWAYVARFKCVLDLIEKDGYRLRRSYPERKKIGGMARMLGSMLSLAMRMPGRRPGGSALESSNPFNPL